MRCLRALLFVLAAFAYALMPVSGMASDHAGVMLPHEMHGAVSAHVGCSDAVNDHKHKDENHAAMGCGHCAACLSLPAMTFTFEAGLPLHSVPMPGVEARLLSQTNLPPVPPPRA